MLLFAEGDADGGDDERLENEAESQGNLFHCPRGSSVIVAAIAEESIPAASLAPALDRLGRVVAG